MCFFFSFFSFHLKNQSKNANILHQPQPRRNHPFLPRLHTLRPRAALDPHPLEHETLHHPGVRALPYPRPRTEPRPDLAQPAPSPVQALGRPPHQYLHHDQRARVQGPPERPARADEPRTRAAAGRPAVDGVPWPPRASPDWEYGAADGGADLARKRAQTFEGGGSRADGEGEERGEGEGGEGERGNCFGLGGITLCLIIFADVCKAQAQT